MGALVTASSIRGHGRRWRAVVAPTVAFVAAAGLVLTLVGCTSATRSDNGPAATSLADRTVEAGSVTIKLQPRQLDADGAAFKISFDTHEVELDQDMVRQARLVVGETPWPVVTWSGDGPGGHHREGELRFTAAGPAAGIATLIIEGLPEPVSATWELGS